MMRWTVSGLICGAMLLGCTVEEEVPQAEDMGHIVATAVIAPRSGNMTLLGTAFVTETDGAIALRIEIDGAPPGKHGVHIHQVGDCSAADASSAGAHWNPDGHMHGMPDMESHLGDLGNMIVREDGKAAITISKPEWKVGDGSAYDLIGRAIVVHANIDDFSDPAGNAGARIGCGVIESAP